MWYTYEKIISSCLLTKKAFTNVEQTKIQQIAQVKQSNLMQDKFPNQILQKICCSYHRGEESILG